MTYFRDEQEVYETIGKPAIARGEIKPQGPVDKILKLVPLTKPIYPRYKAMLQQQGRNDLINV